MGLWASFLVLDPYQLRPHSCCGIWLLSIIFPVVSHLTHMGAGVLTKTEEAGGELFELNRKMSVLGRRGCSG